LKAGLSDPGFMLKTWEPDSPVNYAYPDRGNTKMVVVKDFEIRFCELCNCYKPPRTHHCKKCDRCVVKMDHHCYWIGNCVGYKNHKYFILFLIYVVISCTYDMFVCMFTIYHNVSQKEVSYNISIFYSITIFFVIISIFPIGISVLIMLIFHVKLTRYNMTSIEEAVENKVKKFLDEQNQKWSPPYYISKAKNCKFMFGDNPLFWLLPINNTPKGFDWVIREGYDKAIVEQILEDYNHTEHEFLIEKSEEEKEGDVV